MFIILIINNATGEKLYYAEKRKPFQVSLVKDISSAALFQFEEEPANHWRDNKSEIIEKLPIGSYNIEVVDIDTEEIIDSLA